MSEHTDEPQDWPLRDYSTRLRPPSPGEEPDLADAPEDEVQEETAGARLQSGSGSVSGSGTVSEEPEILYDVDDEVQEETGGAQEETAGARFQSGSGSVSEPAEPEAAVAVEEHAEGEFRIPGGYAVLEGAPTGERRTVAIVVSRFNGEITNRLLDAALAELEEAGVSQDAILVMPVPGAFELPIAAMALAKTRRYACVIALGCVIRGETPHFDFVAGEAASGLQLAGIETGVPVSFGVLTCDTAEQADARVDRGAIAARSALEMADAFAQLRATAARQ